MFWSKCNKCYPKLLPQLSTTCVWAYADSEGPDQSDHSLGCLLTESLHTIKCINGEQMPRWGCVYTGWLLICAFGICLKTHFCLAQLTLSGFMVCLTPVQHWELKQSWTLVQSNQVPKIIKLFSCFTQQSMKFVLLINHKLLTTANSFLLNIAEHENFSANKYENANYCWHFHIY